MFKANRLLAIVALFLFVVIMASCGGGGGDSSNGGGGEDPPPQTTEPTPPPPQTSITDESGQASFLTSQGQIVTFEVKDKDIQQALVDISVTFAEMQNNNIFAAFEDLSGKYVQGIYIDFLPIQTQTSSPQIKIIGVGAVIVIGLATASILWAVDDFYDAVVRIENEIKDFHAVGNNEYIGCMTVKELAQLLWDRNAGAVAAGETLLSIAGGVEKTALKIVGVELAKIGVNEFTKWNLEYFYKKGITNSYSNENEKVGLKIFTMDPKELGFYGAYEILPKEEVCPDSVDNPPPAPTNLRAVPISSNQIDLTWTDTPNETNYLIEYSLDGNIDSRINNVLYCGWEVKYETSWKPTGVARTTLSRHLSLERGIPVG